MKSNTTRIFCIVSAVLYAISCMMPTGIGVETGSENLKGYMCVLLGWLTFMWPPYLPCWVSNFMYMYALSLTYKGWRPDRAFFLSFISFLITVIYIYVNFFIESIDYPNYACYIWSLSYFVLFWGILLQKAKSSKNGSWNKTINSAGVIVSLLLLFGLVRINVKYDTWRGTPVDARYYGYYKTDKGVYFTLSKHHPHEFNMDYLGGVNLDALQVLSNNFAKDDRHVWYHEKVMKHADPATFHLGKNGTPKDANHVYYWYRDGKGVSEYRPVEKGVDVATAEYFVKIENSLHEYDEEWIRDSKHMYYMGRRIDDDSVKVVDGRYYLK